ncbi:MAG: hypothetical protein AAF602_15630 [Myxococcota bacterium]
MRRGQRAAHQRVWWVIAPFLLVAVAYAALFPADPPVVEPPAVLTGGAE